MMHFGNAHTSGPIRTQHRRAIKARRKIVAPCWVIDLALGCLIAGLLLTAQVMDAADRVGVFHG